MATMTAAVTGVMVVLAAAPVPRPASVTLSEVTPVPQSAAMLTPFAPGQRVELHGPAFARLGWELDRPVKLDQLEVELCTPLASPPSAMRAALRLDSDDDITYADLRPCRASARQSGPDKTFCFTDGSYVRTPIAPRLARTIRVDLGQQDSPCLLQVRLLDGGQAVPLDSPRVLEGSAEAPSLPGAYGVMNLFDGRRELAWAAPGSVKAPVLRFTFAQEQRIDGLRVWNGYQRSAQHFSGNSRVLTLEVAGDDGPHGTISLKDADGYQDLALPTPVTGKHLELRVTSVAAGAGSSDLALSELRFLSGGAVLMLDPTAGQRAAAEALRKALGPEASRALLDVQPPQLRLDLHAYDAEHVTSSYGDAFVDLRSDGTWRIHGEVCLGDCAGENPPDCRCRLYDAHGAFAVERKGAAAALRLSGVLASQPAVSAGAGQVLVDCRRKGQPCEQRLFSGRVALQQDAPEPSLHAATDLSARGQLPFDAILLPSGGR